MISTPGIGWDCWSRVRNWSAGGQLEQPSEVKSSTTTGIRDSAAAAAARIAMIVSVRMFVCCAARGETFVCWNSTPCETVWRLPALYDCTNHRQSFGGLVHGFSLTQA